MRNDAPVFPYDDEQEWQRLGERLRDAREYMGFSQGEVAAALGLSRPAVSNMEAGRRKVSGLELARLGALYRRPIEQLLGQAREPEDQTSEALFRTAKDLTERDKEQVLRFAEFLKNAGPPPAPLPDPEEDA